MYEVTVTHDPKTFKRLAAPKKFQWKDREKALDQVNRLRKAGLERHQVSVVLTE